MDEPMTLTEVVLILDSCGAVFWKAPHPRDPAGGDRLAVHGPPLPDELADAVWRHKPALLDLATARGRVADAAGWCPISADEAVRLRPDGGTESRFTPEALERGRRWAALTPEAKTAFLGGLGLAPPPLPDAPRAD
jgi:hypothetical protein